MRHLSIYTKTTCAILALSLTGCGSIINPYVTAKAPTDYLAKDPNSDEPYAGGMAPAITFAVSQHNAYLSAVGDRATFRNTLAFGLIPLTAAGVFVGITGNSRRSSDALTAMAVGGTAAYATGSYFDNAPLEQVYIHGAVAVSCAINMMRPYLIGQTEYGTFRTNTKNLGEAISSVENSINDVIALSAPPLTPKTKSLTTHAQALVNKAKVIQQEGLNLVGKIGASGVTLTSAVKAVEGQVNLQVATLQPSLASLMTTIQGLQGGAGRLLGSLSPPPKTETSMAEASKEGVKKGNELFAAFSDKSNLPTPKISPLDKAIIDLEQNLKGLATGANDVAFVVNTQNARIKSTDTLAACKPTAVANALIVTPSATDMTIKKDVAVVFAVSGGVGNPSASVVGSGASNVTVTGPSLKGNAVQFEVTATADFVGTPQLVFTDGSGKSIHTVFLTLEAAAPDTKPAPTDNAKPGTGDAGATEQN